MDLSKRGMTIHKQLLFILYYKFFYVTIMNYIRDVVQEIQLK